MRAPGSVCAKAAERSCRADERWPLDPALTDLYPDHRMTAADTPAEPVLPPRPERPDCCGGGCAVCVLDGYFEDVQCWEREVAALYAKREAQAGPVDD